MTKKKYQGMFIRLTPKQDKKLSEISEEDGISKAELVRLSVDNLIFYFIITFF